MVNPRKKRCCGRCLHSSPAVCVCVCSRRVCTPRTRVCAEYYWPVLLGTTYCYFSKATTLCFYWIIFSWAGITASLWESRSDDGVHWFSRLIRGFLICSPWFLRLNPSFVESLLFAAARRKKGVLGIFLSLLSALIYFIFISAQGFIRDLTCES